VARCGDAAAGRTLFVLAHHDAHQAGRFYDQSAQRALHRLAPGLLARLKTSPPQWWLGLAGPALTAAGAASGRRGTLRAGLAVTLLATAVVAEIASSPVVPGANDNLSGVAGLVALAELVRDRPIRGLRILLVSCGAEESLQEGVRGFAARHRGEIDGASFLNLETVGSPRLIMLEGEGPIWMEDYTDPSFRDLVARTADEAGVPLERGFRARASTDSVIPSRAGHPTATLTSITEWGALANYHLPTDTPGNLDYETVQAAARLAHALAVRLAAR
jgi:Zn-dependent M28 family amino/carboxypeptidase